MNAAVEHIAEMTATLAPAKRAVLALRSSETEAELKALAVKHKSIVEVTNPDGRDQAHAACMDLRSTRVEIEKRGKAAREDATAFGKAVLAEERRLIALIEPEESRLRALRDAWDDEQKRIRDEQMEAERRRVAALQEKIAFVAGYPARCGGKSALLLNTIILEAADVEFDEAEFGEWIATARAAKESALEQLRAMHAERIELEAEQRRQREAAEAEKARLAEEAERLEKERAEHQRQAAELERQRQEQEERERVAREEIQRQEREARERIEAEQAKIREEQEAERRRYEEQVRIEREAAETEARARREAEEAAASARQAELDRHAAELAEREAALAKASEPAPTVADHLTAEPSIEGSGVAVAAPEPTDDGELPVILGGTYQPYPGLYAICAALAEHFNISAENARLWLASAAEEIEQ